MAAAAGGRGDTRREPAVAEEYEMKKLTFYGLMDLSLRSRVQDVDFVKSYRTKLIKKLRKLELLGKRLLSLCASRHSERTLIQSDLAELRERGERRINEVDSLLVSMGVRVDDLEWNGSVSESSRSSGRLLSDCFNRGDIRSMFPRVAKSASFS